MAAISDPVVEMTSAMSSATKARRFGAATTAEVYVRAPRRRYPVALHTMSLILCKALSELLGPGCA
jgi:hypothetical protein